MFKFENRNYCEYCFEPMHPAMNVCPRCGSQYNAAAYSDCLPVGYMLAGKYLIGRPLGQGGFGKTYLAFDFQKRARVAVKEYFPEVYAYRDSGSTMVKTKQNSAIYKRGVKRFYEEACTLNKFRDCSQIVRVEKMYKENNTSYYVMEYLTGKDLLAYLRDNMSFDESVVIDIGLELLEGLELLHKNGVLHRDISPDNIFLCDNGQLKLIDFGASKMKMGEMSSSISAVVKPGFAPFEQYKTNESQGPWTDIYALGATLYFLLKQKRPPEAVARIQNGALDFSGISPSFAAVLNKMMAVDPKYRFRSVYELRPVLQSLQHHQGRQMTPAQVPRKSFPTWLKVLLIVSGTLSYILLVILILFLLGEV